MSGRSEFDKTKIPEVPETSEQSDAPRNEQPSQEYLEAMLGPKEEALAPQDVPVQGGADEVAKLSEAFKSLESTESGTPVADAIREHDTAVKFGDLKDNTIAEFNSEANAITIRADQRDASPAVLAAHLAHEGTHAIFGDTPNSIDEEFHCFKAEAEVWDELKGDETNGQCDWVSETIALGEDEAKAVFRNLPAYRNLPEYASGLP